MINLYNNCCLEVMKGMADCSVDLTVTSPPYNMNLRIRTSKQGDEKVRKHCSRQLIKEISTKYTDFDDNLSMDEYFEFNKKVITELLRVSKLTFYNLQFLTGNKSALFKLIGEFSENIKEFIIWDKVNSQPAIGDKILNSRFEVLLVLCDKENALSRKFETANFQRGTIENLWQIKRGKKQSEYNGACFPNELASKIISIFSNEGDKILDCFMGSGTTGVNCAKLNRDFIGIELSEVQFNEAQERISHAEHDLINLFA